jgi:hypothetical protein
MSSLPFLLAGCAGAAQKAAVQVIETPVATLRLAKRSGDLVGARWKDPSLEIMQQPKLGENFRLLLPRPGYEAAYFNSTDQQVTRIEETAGGVTCVYESLRNEQETLPVRVWYRIAAAGGQLHLSIEVDNPTDRPLAEVFFGILGGVQGIGDRAGTESVVPGVNVNLAPSLFHRYTGGQYGGGNLGIRYSAGGWTYPGVMTMGWMDYYNRKAGLGVYYANHDPETRITALYTEVRPYTKSAVLGDSWPTAAELPAGEPIGLTMGWMNFPYLAKGRFRSGPLALEAHGGDWHRASETYRAWFDRHFNVKRPPTWLRKEMAWQSVIISNPEDVIAHRFKDLPRLAAEAKKYGVTTFEILGWDTGGIDRGYPQYRPEPRLGSEEEFRQALAEIRKMGVHPVIFTNVQFADTATPLFRERLRQYAVRGRWADDWPVMGWGEGTIGARLGLARSNMTVISPSHPEVRSMLLDQYLQLIRDGAEAFQLDKTVVLGMLDFNPRLPVSPDKSLPEGLLATFRELLERGRKINPDLALASEVFVDRTFPYVDVSYVRMNEIDMPSTALRYTFPEWTSTIFAESPGDINIMNNGMRYGLVWALAPRHYNDSMDEPLTRPLSRYVSELIRIRSKYRDLLFHGRFKDDLGAEVKADPHIRYSVFEPLEPGGRGRACVIVNYANQEQSAEVNWPGGAGRQVEISAPFQPDRKATLPVKLTLAAQTCQVVVER